MSETIKLNTPVGETGEITLNFDDVKGRDLVSAQRDFELLTGEPTSGLLELDKNYQAFFASKISNVPYDTILEFDARDFISVTMMVQRFLLRRA